MKASLSLEMQRCLTFAKKNGGSLYRCPGGFWGHKDWEQTAGRHFRTTTIEALCSRGLLAYSDWKEGRAGKFPIRATLYQETGAPRAIDSGNRIGERAP